MRNNKFWNFLKRKGYYLALALCAVAIGVAGYVHYSQDTVPQFVVEETHAPAMNSQPREDDTVLVLGTTPTTEATLPTRPTEPTSLETMWPVNGETVTVFAADKLTYNETTRDWRVHHGVDLEAAQGTEVLAAADGTVYTVYEDELLGTTVVIRHAGGYVTTYASLDEKTMVTPGQAVTMGQVIGTVGQTALTERALGHHVHFGVSCNDQAVDPVKFMELTNRGN